MKLAAVSTLAIAAVIAGCDSSTAPAPCGEPTSASFVATLLTIGRLTAIHHNTDGSEVLDLAVSGDPGFTAQVTIASNTAVFEQTDRSPAEPSNACRLHIGNEVYFPFEDGFGDFVNTGDGSWVPPTMSEIVINRR